MPKNEEKAPEGAPEWMVTFSDVMTLLLCFFRDSFQHVRD